MIIFEIIGIVFVVIMLIAIILDLYDEASVRGNGYNSDKNN